MKIMNQMSVFLFEMVNLTMSSPEEAIEWSVFIQLAF